MTVATRVGDLFEATVAPPSKWFCDRPDCDGDPHDGFHWCGHPIDSDQHDWTCRHARAEQRPPESFASGAARTWLLMAGRGFGKTRSGAEWLADQAQRNPNSYWGVLAPTKEDLEDTCFEGESGLLQALDISRDDERYNKSKTLIRLDNGTVINSYSAETPRRVRGPNLWGTWCEEIAQWKTREMWDNLFPAIRRGLAQTVITSTPAPVPLLLEFANRDDGSVAITRGSTYSNEKNLAPAQIAELKIRWQGTRRERQELFGELLEDVPGALWNAANIEGTRAVLLG